MKDEMEDQMLHVRLAQERLDVALAHSTAGWLAPYEKPRHMHSYSVIRSSSPTGGSHSFSWPRLASVSSATSIARPRTVNIHVSSVPQQ